MKPVRVLAHVEPHVALSPWARAALTDEDTAELERRAQAQDTTVGIVKRRDGRWLARTREGQAIGRTPYGAAMAVLGGIDCE